MSTSLMNCLEYNLLFWKEHPEFRIYYNADHVISLDPKTQPPTNYLPLSEYGFEHLALSFRLCETFVSILKDYLEEETLSTILTYPIFEIDLTGTENPDTPGYSFVFNGARISVPYSIFRFGIENGTLEDAKDLVEDEILKSRVKQTA